MMNMELGGLLEFPELKAIEREESAYYYLTNLYENYDFFGDGRQAIKAILLNIEGIRDKTCYLPAYTCDSILQSFEELELDVTFYSHEEPLEPILDGNIKNSLIYLIDYFGKEAISEKEIEEFLDNGNVVVLDVSHSILDKSRFALNHEDLYLITSIRKIFPIPDGGMVYHSDPNFESSDVAPKNYEKKLEAMMLKKMYLERSNRLKGLKEHFLNLNQEYEDYKYDFVVEPQSIPLTSCYILKNISIRDITNKRWQNLSLVHKEILNKEILLFNLDDIKSPFMLALKFKNEDERDGVKKKLIKNNVYPPIIWDLESYIPEDFAYERNLSKRILTVPVDQRYGFTEMSKVVEILNSR